MYMYMYIITVIWEYFVLQKFSYERMCTKIKRAEINSIIGVALNVCLVYEFIHTENNKFKIF